MKLFQAYIDSCQKYQRVTELLNEEISVINDNPELLSSFFWVTNQVAEKNILKLEELKSKENLSKEEEVEFFKIALDLKTANQLYHLRFKSQLPEFLDKLAWTSKFKQFVNTSPVAYRWDEEKESLFFIDEQGNPQEVKVPSWTDVIAAYVFPRTTPFFYLFALSTFSDSEVDLIRHAYVSYLSRGLIKKLK